MEYSLEENWTSVTYGILFHLLLISKKYWAHKETYKGGISIPQKGALITLNVYQYCFFDKQLPGISHFKFLPVVHKHCQSSQVTNYLLLSNVNSLSSFLTDSLLTLCGMLDISSTEIQGLVTFREDFRVPITLWFQLMGYGILCVRIDGEFNKDNEYIHSCLTLRLQLNTIFIKWIYYTGLNSHFCY